MFLKLKAEVRKCVLGWWQGGGGCRGVCLLGSMLKG